MKGQFYINLLVSACLVLACTEEEIEPIPLTQSPIPATPDSVMEVLNWDFKEGIAIVGSGYGQKDIAISWTDSRQVLVSDPNAHTTATSVYRAEEDLYVVGYEYNWDVYNGFYHYPTKAVLWKNGVVYPLTDGSKEAAAYSIFVYQDDVYAVGYEGKIAMLWKNGVPVALSDGSSALVARSVFVDKGIVYVVGNDSDHNRALLWENGTMQELLKGTSASSVFVSDGDVYVAGGGENAMLWKNGEPQPLETEKGLSVANAVIVEGEDIYVAGFQVLEGPIYRKTPKFSSDQRIKSQYGHNEAVYGPPQSVIWKNGVPSFLLSKTLHSKAYSIVVKEGKLYVTGMDGDQAVIWENDQPYYLGKGVAIAAFAESDS